jgi:excinuclease ABC subunit C
VLYVGKAKSLKNRLLSYAHKNLDLKTQKLLHHTHQTKFQVLPTEFDALLLEAQLIRLYSPFYNLQAKDDKSYLYIILTDDTFPKVLTVRKSDLANYRVLKIFGPFSSSTETKALLRYIRRLFPFCNQAGSKLSKRACFYYHLDLCPGACVGQISPSRYRESIKHIELLLSGKRQVLSRKLLERINQAKETLDFESAQSLKRQWQELQQTPHLKKTAGELIMPSLESNLLPSQAKKLQAWINQHTKQKINELYRIEFYDISNLQGTFATGSMVVYQEGAIAKDQYRRFKINLPATPNDPAMMAHMLSRRQNHPEWTPPNLIILDGGLTQISQVLKINKWNIPILGLAKNPDRLVIPKIFSKESKNHKHTLTPQNGRLLVTLLRNEAHRFAKNYFSLRLKKSYTAP